MKFYWPKKEHCSLNKELAYLKADFSLGLATLDLGMIKFFHDFEYGSGDITTRAGWLLLFLGSLFIAHSFIGYKQNLQSLHQLKNKKARDGNSDH